MSMGTAAASLPARMLALAASGRGGTCADAARFPTPAQFVATDRRRRGLVRQGRASRTVAAGSQETDRTRAVRALAGALVRNVPGPAGTPQQTRF